MLIPFSINFDESGRDFGADFFSSNDADSELPKAFEGEKDDRKREADSSKFFKFGIISALLRLGRFDKPIGIVLLLFPCWWGVALASGFAIDFQLLGLLAVGATVMRAAGCIINDLFDRDIDRQVERTKGRPLASREVSVKAALLFLMGLLVVGVMVLVELPQRCWPLAIFAALIATIYPLAKRFIRWPQLVLGIAYNMGLPIGVAAVSPQWMTWPVLLAYVAAILWTLAYDTIYALQDRDDDRRIGIGSTALVFGDQVKIIVALLYAAMHALFMFDFYMMGGLNIIDGACLLTSLFFIFYRLYDLDPHNREVCRRFFVGNQWVGMLIFIACIFK